MDTAGDTDVHSWACRESPIRGSTIGRNPMMKRIGAALFVALGLTVFAGAATAAAAPPEMLYDSQCRCMMYD